MEKKRDDTYFMQRALKLAQKAALKNEVPVGAVIVHDGRIVGRGWNQVESRKDASGHAEMTALKQAARKLGRWRLTGCTLYVTLEPCAMCAGAMVLARIDRLVYTAPDPKAGACGSVFNIVEDKRLNHRIKVERGLLAKEASQLLKDFFKKRRT
ncbi:MAG: tRNA-specific adenosine deaminase [Candidatus Edwardsbacteria bacterium GWF2_54_11]|uniref:tRNA-specific adenosine deaminase n=1 Tax=Candidatus Edwardsbacteria bacterium GWF2_54_11 TaxID=1817851 RepID=A0A1F5RHW9_9BACT|nr:MAG: tRNA-specific adenosine deaminase [Candidatus Edwardsbacteria bacterium RifOxyC12_full_54_24]OGF13988.1 MAG: tRNA-specific adenosine deaminase [Candidatus Edwardsbacteria bacterium GWF2_54_11]OGJ17608.1 MAG: tRNA-specific adenosine deaminase [Candidatus Edwardsbacteria bacterium RifOxyB12_full_52_30]